MAYMAPRTPYEAAFQRWLQEGGPMPRPEDFPAPNEVGPSALVERGPRPLPQGLEEREGIGWQGLPDFLRNLPVPQGGQPFDDMRKPRTPSKGRYVAGPTTNWIQQAILRRSQ